MADWSGIRHITVIDRLEELVAEKPDAPCCQLGEMSHTYRSIQARAQQIAGSMGALGVQPGSRVATLAPNRPEVLEQEQAISVHPYVLETAVHAVPSEIEEDDIKACVVVQRGATLEPEPFFDWLRANVPYYAVPRYVDVLEALPKNPVNRVLKTVLRETGNTEATWDFRELGLVIGRDQRR